MRFNYFIIIIAFSLASCKKHEGCTDPAALNYDAAANRDDGSCKYVGVNYPYELDIPSQFAQLLPAPSVPANNPLTEAGVLLGRKLFYDPILSGNNTQSCADCHKQANGFTDNGYQFSTGIDLLQGDRNAMPLFNMAWNYNDTYFWDGKASGIEDQVFEPVANPIEMHETWPNAVAKLQSDEEYPSMFNTAFGAETIDSNLVTMAIAQFERTLISGDSRFDKYMRGEISLTPSEFAGYNVFMDEAGGDCFHCHGDINNPLWTDNIYHNNALDATFSDLGRGAVTGNAADNGKFKTPSLRNLSYTAPYMHDGRFATLDEVINHYAVGLQNSATVDPLMKNVLSGGNQLNPQDRIDLKAFLLSLDDPNFITNPDYQAP